jgi:hypothetical protein
MHEYVILLRSQVGRHIFEGIIGLIFIFGGFAMLAFTLSMIRKNFELRKWPATRGLILKAGTKVTQTINYVFDVSKLVIAYSYQVDGKQYVGSKLNLMNSQASDIIKQMQIAHLHPGREVFVYYNPAKPEEAYLERGIHFKFFFLFLAGLIMMAAGVGIFVSMFV